MIDNEATPAGGDAGFVQHLDRRDTDHWYCHPSHHITSLIAHLRFFHHSRIHPFWSGMQ